MSKNYIKVKKKFIQFFQDRFLAKKRPLRDAARQKKQVFEKHGQGGHKKGLHKRDGKKMVMDGVSLQALARSYWARTWGMEWEQGKAIWNGNGAAWEGPKQPKIGQKYQITRILGRGWSKLTFDQGHRHEFLFPGDPAGSKQSNIAYLIDFEEIRFFDKIAFF